MAVLADTEPERVKSLQAYMTTLQKQVLSTHGHLGSFTIRTSGKKPQTRTLRTGPRSIQIFTHKVSLMLPVAGKVGASFVNPWCLPNQEPRHLQQPPRTPQKTGNRHIYSDSKEETTAAHQPTGMQTLQRIQRGLQIWGDMHIPTQVHDL